MPIVVLILGVFFLLLQFGDEASAMVGGCCFWSFIVLVGVGVIGTIIGVTVEPKK